MISGASERFIEVPHGLEGSLATLERMAAMVNEADAYVDRAAQQFLDYAESHGFTPRELAHFVFEWVRSRMIYSPDYDDGVIIEEIRTPGVLLREIALYGNAIGDCDDYVVLYGALYRRLGWSVTFQAISTYPDQLLNHVYLSIGTDEARLPIDGIVSDPFGWEVPASEVTKRIEWPV